MSIPHFISFNWMNTAPKFLNTWTLKKGSFNILESVQNVKKSLPKPFPIEKIVNKCMKETKP